MSPSYPEERVWRLVRAARRLADPETALGKRARSCLSLSTGLSPENVEACLTHCLETEPRLEDVQGLCRASRPAPNVYIVLASTVFVGTLRALCLGAASSPNVFVRPSRREPEMVDLLKQALLEEAPSGSEPSVLVVDKLTPECTDHVHAYGGSRALAAIAGTLPSGTVFFGHGPGFGVAALNLVLASERELERTATALAWDAALFDQGGCLSPRLVFVRADAAVAARFAEILAEAQSALEATLPVGNLGQTALAERTRYLQTMTYACRVFPTVRTPGRISAVSFDDGGSILALPPPARLLHVVRSEKISAALEPLQRSITSVGCFGGDLLRREISAALPNARITDVGRMQAPPLDGPVDRRTAPVLL